jgi:hypothetical protein
MRTNTSLGIGQQNRRAARTGAKPLVGERQGPAKTFATEAQRWLDEGRAVKPSRRKG